MISPSIKVLEELVPELSGLACTPKTKNNQIANFCQRMETAARLWTIKQSLSNPNSDFFIEIGKTEFQCAEWEKLFFDKTPEAKNLTLADFLLGEYTSVYIQSWKKSIIKRYQIEPDVLANLLTSNIFVVDSRTFRNHFKRLTKLEKPVLKKVDSSQGKYKKVKLQQEITDNSTFTDIWENTEEDILSFFNDGLSTIAELLLTKINGQQRLFIHTEYVVTEELQDVAGDWADNLKENWQQSAVNPLEIEYNSASKKKIREYLIFPVCIYYYQRACYLCAFGQTPNDKSTEEKIRFNWYNYRLERIKNLQKKSWQANSTTQALQTEIYRENSLKYEYTPEYIQKQLNLAYGFDFYRPLSTMLLRFNRDFSQRYIENTDRHPTFLPINDQQKLENLIAKSGQLTSQQQQYLLEKVTNNIDDYDCYSLNYRVRDNNVIMRLRSWSPNVEVILPWDLRQRMKEDIEKTWKLYESD